MILPADGREYVKWPVTDAPDGATFEAQFQNTATPNPSWVAAGQVVDGNVRVLVAGPNATGEGATVLPTGRTTVRLRVVDSPEIVVRGGGIIDVK